MSKLVDGLIPKNTVCPFREQCKPNPGFCHHKSEEHNVDFSCALARGYDIIKRKGTI